MFLPVDVLECVRELYLTSLRPANYRAIWCRG